MVPVCCKRMCCCGSIETCYLRELRRKFLDCHNQVDRKRFVLNLRNPESPTGFSIAPGNCHTCGRHIVCHTAIWVILKFTAGKPLCYNALNTVLGISFCLIASCAGTPRARAPAQANRRPRLGKLPFITTVSPHNANILISLLFFPRLHKGSTFGVKVRCSGDLLA